MHSNPAEGQSFLWGSLGEGLTVKTSGIVAESPLLAFHPLKVFWVCKLAQD